ncbi:hypothetical protein C0J52_00124 [Blattella germanica]|nr:hypothetical protein C0J52_00124 [Blattella germanica]
MAGGRKMRALRARKIANALRDVLQFNRKDKSQADSTEDTSNMNWNEYGRMKAISLCYIRRLVTLLAAYALGYFSFSIAWLLLITLGIVVLKDHSVQQKLKTKFIKDTVQIKETSTESVEWLNQPLHLSNVEVLQESPPGEIVICTDIA